MVTCATCGAGFADTRAPQSAYDAYYEQFSKYDDRQLGTGGGIAGPDRQRLQETAALLKSHALPRGSASRILDVGCAGGGLLAALQQEGFPSVAGVDPSPACVERVRQQGIACTRARLSELGRTAGEGTCDLVILSHVLEHVVDVRGALDAVGRLLAAGGLCYIEVPDAARYAVDAFVPFYFFDCEHINHFDGDALGNLAAVSGFEVVSQGQRDLPLEGDRNYPAVWALLKRTGGRRPPREAFALREQLAAYVEQSARALDHAELDRLAEARTPVLLWGAGSHAQRLLSTSSLRSCRLVGIVDRDTGKHGRRLLGHSIRFPEEVLPSLDPGVTIVIASVLHGEQIARSLAGAGLPHRAVIVS